MTSFRLNNRVVIVAKREKTRNGFRHRVTLLIDGSPVDEVTVHYLNRTWESYEYESAINKLIDKTSQIAPAMKQQYKDKLAGRSHEQTTSKFKAIGMVASMGNILAKTRVEKNLWKKRMIKAGLGDGLQMPKNWDKLPEGLKETRLDKVISNLINGKSKTKSMVKKKLKKRGRKR